MLSRNFCGNLIQWRTPDAAKYYYTTMFKISSIANEEALEFIRDLPVTPNTLHCYLANRFRQSRSYVLLKEAGKLDAYESYAKEKLGDDYDACFEEPGKYAGTLNRVFGPWTFEAEFKDEDVDVLLGFDILDRLPHTYHVIQKVINRCMYLKENYPTFWKETFESNYHDYFMKIYSNFKQSTISPELLRQCTKVFPDIYVELELERGFEDYVDYTSPQVKKIMGLPPNAHEDAVKEKYAILKNDDERERFIEEQRVTTKAYIDSFENGVLRNTNDLASFEPLTNFYLEDLVTYKDERGMVYLFTIDDCRSLLQRGNNPYNNLPLIGGFIETVIHELRTKPDAIVSVRESLDRLYKKEELDTLVKSCGFGSHRAIHIYNDNTPSRRLAISKQIVAITGVLYGAVHSWRTTGALGFGLYTLFCASYACMGMSDTEANDIVLRAKNLVSRFV